MKKIYRNLLIGFFVITAVLVGFAYLSGKKNIKTDLAREKLPERLAASSIYGEDINLTEQVDDCMFNIKAKSLYLKKTKTIGFDNALFKKLVAKKFYITISKGNKKVLSLHKTKLSMRPDMKIIQVKNPQILYPENMPPPKKVSINKIKKKIIFHYGKKTETWDLNAELPTKLPRT